MTLLYLDFDGPAIPVGLIDRIVWATSLWKWPIEAVRFDRTRRGWHVVIGIRKRIAAPVVVAAQAALGSDPRREIFNLMRVQSLSTQSPFWRARWNVLYSQHVNRKE